MRRAVVQCFVFFFNDTATTEIYTLSLHDALPISWAAKPRPRPRCWHSMPMATREPRIAAARGRSPDHEEPWKWFDSPRSGPPRSEEHTSELQSRQYLVCRLLLEKKKNKKVIYVFE